MSVPQPSTATVRPPASSAPAWAAASMPSAMPLTTVSQASSVETIMREGPVIPVIVIRDRAHAVPLARALVAGGVRVLEVTLRTDAALDAIRAMRAEVPQAIVGAGTVLSPEQLRSVAALDVAFAVSPGMTDRLVDAADERAVPLFPGVATAGEVMRALDLGYRHLKLFPAEPAGGIPYLKALASPCPRPASARPAASICSAPGNI